MAAKVVMVAVPTVLGIASIRVYSVSEAPAGGLLAREKLNIYTPLPWYAQAEFVPERPGVIESGLTKARESILPFIQAVKVACVSVKMGSVNLYHAGEDAYYYLRDPPPGFLPRFGTITMAGLLGMFLARKGSRFKRLAIPLGLMSAGASVCYPAQAVVLFKVTGKKVYNAGQWSSAVVSSLLTSKPQEPIAKETTASQPQSATSSNVESEVVEDSEPRSTTDNSPQSATVPETKVETAVSLPVFDEPIAAVKEKEASSLTLTEILPEQASTETNTGALLHSVPAETVTTSPSEEQPAPVESEESSDTKQIPEEISNEATPAESTASLESGTLEVAPADSAEVELAPSSKEPPAPEASDKPAVPVVESAEPEPTAQPELSDQPLVAALEETPFPTVTPPKLEQPAAENNKEGSVFKPDPSLMDFGQANPEDEDLYSTRS